MVPWTLCNSENTLGLAKIEKTWYQALRGEHLHLTQNLPFSPFIQCPIPVLCAYLQYPFHSAFQENPSTESFMVVDNGHSFNCRIEGKFSHLGPLGFQSILTQLEA